MEAEGGAGSANPGAFPAGPVPPESAIAFARCAPAPPRASWKRHRARL